MSAAPAGQPVEASRPPEAPTSPAVPRPRWLPGAVVALVCVLVAGGMYLADRPGYVTDARDSAYAAADGASWYATTTVQRGNQVRRQTSSLESARYDGLVGVQAGDAALVDRALRPLGTAELEKARIWRTVGTPAEGTADQQTTFYRVDGAIRRLGETGGARPRVFSPAVVELPAGANPGDHWISAGQVENAGEYRADLTASAAPENCLDVAGTVTFGGAVASTEDVSRRWCPGRGLVREQSTTRQGDAVPMITTIERGGSPAALDVRARPDPGPVVPTWPRAGNWRLQNADTLSLTPGLGTAPQREIPAFVPPVTTATARTATAGSAAADTLIRATIPGRDVITVAAPEGAGGSGGSGGTTAARLWRTQRRMHPGGDIVSLAVFGQVVVAATTNRELVGYSSSGFRLWQLSTDDLVRMPPVRSGPGTMIATTVAGSVVAVDLVTGRLLWSVQPGDDLEAPAATGPSSVLVSDRSGRLSNLDPATGQPRWTLDRAAADRMSIMGDQLIVASGSTLDATALSGGRLRWRISLPGTATGLTVLGDRVIVATQQGTRVVDRNGHITARLAAYQQLITRQGLSDDAPPATEASVPVALGWTGERIDLIGPQATVLRSVPVASGLQTLGELSWLVPDRTGALLLTSPEWTFRMLGDG